MNAKSEKYKLELPFGLNDFYLDFAFWLEKFQIKNHFEELQIYTLPVLRVLINLLLFSSLETQYLERY